MAAPDLAKPVDTPLSEITPADYNPRDDLQPGDPEWDALVASIETFGLVEPLVVNARTGRLISGHQRFAVLRHLGHDTAPVITVDLDDTKERQLNVAMNRLKGAWDDQALATLLDQITDTSDADDILLATGFTEVDVDTAYRRADAAAAGDVLAAALDRPDPDDIPADADGPTDNAPPPPVPSSAGIAGSGLQEWFTMSIALPIEQRPRVVAAVKHMTATADVDVPTDGFLALLRWGADTILPQDA